MSSKKTRYARRRGIDRVNVNRASLGLPVVLERGYLLPRGPFRWHFRGGDVRTGSRLKCFLGRQKMTMEVNFGPWDKAAIYVRKGPILIRNIHAIRGGSVGSSAQPVMMRQAFAISEANMKAGQPYREAIAEIWAEEQQNKGAKQ